MDLWNVKDLDPPPVSSCIVTTKEIDIRLLEIALNEAVNFFQNENHLSTEGALLSRSVYRFKTKFRSSKDFKSVEILNRILQIYLQMRIPQMLRTLQDSIPRKYKMNKAYMLTKNMMDYVLVRFQGLGKILCRILESCKTASALMQQRLRLGHFWKIALVMFAATSRIFVVTKSILKYTCELYTKLLPFSACLGNSGTKWLPDSYCFPNRLDEWLKIDWLDLENNVIEIPDDEPIMSYLKLTDSDDEVEFCDEYILVRDETIDSIEIEEEEDKEKVDLTETDKEEVNCLLTLTDETDVGEIISVDSLEPKKRAKRKRKKKTPSVVEVSDTVDTGVSDNCCDNQQQTRGKKRKRVSRSVKRKINSLNKSSDMNDSSESVIVLSSSPKKQSMSNKRKRKKRKPA